MGINNLGIFLFGICLVAFASVEAQAPAKTKDLVMTRVFDAPVADVFKHWSESEKVKNWWGPTGFECPLAKMDFKVGGKSLLCMRFPRGKEYYNTWTYKKIVPNKFIELVSTFADKEGNKVDPMSLGLPPEMPNDVRQTISFKVLSDKKTEMTVTEYGYPSDQLLNLSKMGLSQCLDKMAKSLAK